MMEKYWQMDGLDTILIQSRKEIENYLRMLQENQEDVQIY